MQSNQFKSDSVNSNLHLNQTNIETNIFQSQVAAKAVNPLDSTLLDSLNANYVAPDSVIYFSYRPEYSQFRKPYDNFYDYQKHLLQPLPYDSLHTVLKNVEVVFPGKKLTRNNPDWLVGVLVLAFFLFATVRLIFNKYLSQLAQATINYSTFTRVFREKYFNFFHASFRLDVVFNLIMSLFGYQFLSNYKVNFGIRNSFYVYLICLGIVIGYFIVKKVLYFLVGIMTESRREVKEYLFSITVFNRVLGLFLLPVTAIIAFVPLYQPELLLFSGLGIILIFYLLSLARGVKIFLRKHFSISYLILYLCTLEFLPLLLVYNILLI
ncbi:MAG TPA: DUF4271 domain-containing protein [Prolixibacteraceae bacterium]|jgi:hypothetical protein